MNCHGILKSDDIITRFFQLSTQMVIESCYRLIADQSQSSTYSRTKQFQIIDGYVKLIILLITHSGDTNAVSTKTNLLNKVNLKAAQKIYGKIKEKCFLLIFPLFTLTYHSTSVFHNINLFFSRI